MTTPIQERWGQYYQPIPPQTPPPPYVPPPGWQQQAKYRRKKQQNQSVQINLGPQNITVQLQCAQVNVQAYPFTPEVIVGINESAVNVQSYTTTPQVKPNIGPAQVNVQAYPLGVSVATHLWQQQSKWRRKYRQRETSYPVPPTIVQLAVAQVNVTAYPVTPTINPGLNVAQINVQAYPVTPSIIPNPLGPQPQARWGQYQQAISGPPVINVTVPLGVAQVNIQANPVVPSVATHLWQQQSKWRRKTKQPSFGPVNVIGGAVVVNLPTAAININAYLPSVSAGRVVSGGSGSSGSIKFTYVNTTDMLYSLAGLVGTDGSGNAFVVGWQGPISAMAPGGSLVVTETWHSLSLSNASASGNGANGFFYRYKSANLVELLWDIALSATSGVVGTLPIGYRPIVQQNVVSGWYGTGPSSYTRSFMPHLLVTGASDSVAGQINLEGFPLTTISLFGRETITLDGDI